MFFTNQTIKNKSSVFLPLCFALWTLSFCSSRLCFLFLSSSYSQSECEMFTFPLRQNADNLFLRFWPNCFPPLGSQTPSLRRTVWSRLKVTNLALETFFFLLLPLLHLSVCLPLSIIHLNSPPPRVYLLSHTITARTELPSVAPHSPSAINI